MRNSKTIYILIILFAVALIPACIEEYTPKVEDELSDILVVEGAISGGENTVIKLSRSVELSAESTFNPVFGAVVYVERSDGWTSEPGNEAIIGEYHIRMGELDTSLSYSIVIQTEGKEYRSKPAEPIITPAIDSLSWKKKGDGEPVTIHVTTHDTNSAVGYYRWSYKEDWEIHAAYFANGDYDFINEVYTPYLLDGLNTYYCWNSDSSRVLLLGDTEKLSGNLIYEKKLVTIEATHDKLSYLYSILVKQWTVSKQAYQYLSNLQNNIDEAGSIFAPQPSELPGNVTCVTSPEEVVIGYIDVATVTEKRLYITEKEAHDPARKPEQCKTESVEGKSNMIKLMQEEGLVLLDAAPDFFSATLTERRCVDCKYKGSKVKPDFWPNNHQ
ncbi:DUF4249 domain-containing protein [Massilibacteroides sp.]|uniref:DUF4249 domain-containing protein n=1 Tax=Massilibacteroides sp. TaxID=2034766 RepID=UPI002629418C|nr:DUF4249 domain-containing protein [Massilibacteroides sp.]MDD4515267.1 DUF4249 domain-containing protein [Massilibacteroides sp.]